MYANAQRLRRLWGVLIFLLLLDACRPTPTPTPTPVISKLPPILVARTPEPGQEVTPEMPLRLVFSEPMDRASVEANLRVIPAVAGRFAWEAGDRILRLLPQAPWKPDTEYEVRLENARARNGQALARPVAFRFRTASPLAVAEVIPAPDARDVDPQAAVTVIFNRPVVPLRSDLAPGDLPQPLAFDPPIRGTGRWINTSIYSFQPEGSWAAGRTYTARVVAGLRDLTGMALEKDYTWTFTIRRPAAIAYAPRPGRQMDMDLSAPISITFNMEMDRTSVESAFSLREGAEDGPAVPGRFEWISQTVLFRPAQPLKLETRYFVRLEQRAAAPSGATLEGAVAWAFTTPAYPRLQSASLSPQGPNRLDPGDSIELRFSSGAIRPETVWPNLRLEPPISATRVFTDWNPENGTFSLSGPWTPGTVYTLTVGPEIADRYGNRLDRQHTFTFTVNHLDPLAYLNIGNPYSPLVVVGTYTETSAFLSTRNLDRVTFTLSRLELERFIALSQDPEATFRYSAPNADLVARWTFTVPEVITDVIMLNRIPLAGLGRRTLPTGLYHLRVDAPVSLEHRPGRYLVAAVDLNVVVKVAPQEALVWVTDMATGRPAPGIPVQLFEATEEHVEISGVRATDANGIARFEWSDPVPLWRMRVAVAGTPGGRFGVGASAWSDGIEPWAFHLPADYEPPRFRVYWQTDKPIYRPGQTVHFKAIVRSDDDARYAPPANRTFPVRIEDPEGREVYSTTLTLNEFGTAEGAFPLAEDAMLGRYTLMADLPPGPHYHSISFLVAAYRRPEFQVTLTPERPAYVAGERIRAALQATYYFGGPVAGAKVEWTARAQPYFFESAGPGYYSWSDFDPYSAYEGEAEKEIASGSGTTDAQGRFWIELPTGLGMPHGSQRVILEASVTDPNDNLVAGRTEVVVHAGRFYIGLQAERYVGEAGRPLTMTAKTVDWESRPVGSVALAWTAYRREWFSVMRETDRGPMWTWAYSDTAVVSGTLQTDAEGMGRFAFIPPDPGTYVVKAEGTDVEGHRVRSAEFIWVSGRGAVAWRQENNDRIELVADRREYAPGDTATILVPSPFTGTVTALITVERGRIRRAEVRTLQGNAPTLSIPLSEEDAPNIFVSVILIQGVSRENPAPGFKMGMVNLPVKPTRQTLRMELIPDRAVTAGAHYGPREIMTVTVRTTDADGRPVPAEVAVAVVDASVLALVDPNAPPIVEGFYGRRNLSVLTGVSLIYNLNRVTARIARERKGGGGGVAEAFGEIRREFPDTAYWNAVLRTDASGTATFSVRLPDNLTTWRITAKGVTLDTRVGEATLDVLSTKDLLIRPSVPRFFVAGDRATLGAAVHNHISRPLTVTVRLEAKGFTLESPAAQEGTIPPGGVARFEWTGVVERGKAVDLTFYAEGGGFRDATKPTLARPDGTIPVLRYVSLETVATAGMLETPEPRQEIVAIPPEPEVTGGTLTLRLSPSLAATALDSLTWLQHFEYECTEQTISRFLPNIVTYQTLLRLNLARPDLEERLRQQVAVGLQKLYAGQHADGGWGWFPSMESDPLTTAYAVFALAQARASGFAVADGVIERGLAFLRRSLEAPADLSPWKANRQAFMLFAMAEAGAGDAGRIVALWEAQKEHLALYARAFLAMALGRTQADHPLIPTLLNSVVEQAHTTATGAFWEEKGLDDFNWNTDTRTSAIALLSLLRLDPKNPLAFQAVRGLMAARRADRWETTQETAWALMALTEWMAQSGELEGNYTWTVRLNDQVMGSGSVDPAHLQETVTLQQDIAGLLREAGNALELSRSAGPGVLYYTVHLAMEEPVERIAPRSRGLTLSRQYLRPDDPCLKDRRQPCAPVTSARVGDLLMVRLTLVVPRTVHHLVLEDPYPAGMEAIDPSLKTSPMAGRPPELQRVDPRDPFGGYGWWGWWWFGHTALYDDRAALFAEYLPPGTYEYTYMIRAGWAGQFQTRPARAYAFYFPEIYGQSEGMRFEITR
ncbi:Ig-like domain-containing protein [Thermoflexus sp.]|uniref:Ig-like domain-containing protein n=1 Tax=Thermoflexus sp. TaxID=1969742 RepID=UPI002ADE2BA5|nr:Ig-like domain-containing protein [Thermoflexus sp.]